MKEILITGCSTGFGYDSSKYLAEKGHHVYASMRNTNGKNAKAASELTEFASANNLKIEVIEMDVTSDESVSAAVSRVPAIDVLINNAGFGYAGPIEAFSSDEIMAQLDLNIVGTLRAAKAVLPGMRAQESGLIIQVSSGAGRSAFPGFGIYHASKWGLEGVSEALRYELAAFGIDVVIVEPGPFSTNFMGNIVLPKNEEIASAYKHVMEFNNGLVKQFLGAYEDENAPTDPKIVVEIFEKLINTPAGSRPIRTMAGLDLGFQAFNDVTEPIRTGALESLGIADWDGPRA